DPDAQPDEISSPRRRKSEDAIRDLVVRTDAEGHFRLAGLPDWERYELRILHHDFAEVQVEGLAIRGGEALEGLEVWLLRGATVRGRVVNRQGAGVPASVCIQETGRFAAVNADGRYLLPNLPAGHHVLQAQLGRLEALREITVAEGDSADGIDLFLPEEEVLAGRVLDPEGGPVADARIEANSLPA